MVFLSIDGGDRLCLIATQHPLTEDSFVAIILCGDRADWFHIFGWPTEFSFVPKSQDTALDDDDGMSGHAQFLHTQKSKYSIG